MCGPKTHCCFNVPIVPGVRCIAIALSVLEVGLMAHNLAVAVASESAFEEVVGKVDIEIEDLFVVEVVAISTGYSSAIFFNILLLVATFIKNR